MHQMVKRTDNRPPWTGDDAAMFRWLRARCRELLKKELGEQLNEVAWLERELEQFPARDLAVFRALAAADCGDIQPLREASRVWQNFFICPNCTGAKLSAGNSGNSATSPWTLTRTTDCTWPG